MFSYSTISIYQDQVFKGETTCLEATNYYLEKINITGKLNAFVEVYASESIERAKHLDEKRISGKPCGKLHGVIIAIKDVICYKDHTVTASSGILKNFVSVYNSTVVENLLKEDAIIIGSCNCDEFAMGSTNENSVYGRVLNALDKSKVPGGSSGGSAVAVQAGLCMVSLGSDTGGSVRQPADFCGITGIKPSYGCISRNGLIAYASSFDQVGIFSNNVEDAAIVLEVINGPDEYDSTVNQQKQKEFQISHQPKKYKIALLKNALGHRSLDQEIKKNIYDLAEQLREDGNEIEEIDFDLIDFIVPAYYVLTTAEASSNLSRYDGVRYGFRHQNDAEDLAQFYKKTRSEGFGKEVKRRIMLGTFVLSEGYYDAYFTKAQQIRRLLVNQTEEIFKSFDALIMPTVPSTAFEAGSMQKDPIAIYLADIYTVYANLTGTPAISLPLFKHSNGMPFGLQVITNKHNELTLLELSDKLMKNYKRY
ncbi:Asp-tRNA(Asn)/Glu-tRNA(Gln) amidotransferase subunit GatA [Ginsengibacter hankyongi]|uniref:Glutamyl-tRNA(Gln) amidotransferase subunit A n=1 Tax=Ginsengibacter hankyongi TaxID=2607284 RepID=A0A5J5IPY0_9BACT|nr:Asp-tRNA(Asn)/Glu-tRNA(Gln) amidotransferase subunit GatA [Ginsengibacter hankyongi]KAA9041592.1 Asp-tRNA(Asn)/Glu-tRNA(Gln) amidotransferase subunit GatA [Ginsengibacter hankyongi]